MKLVLDTHTHTISSGHAYSTITENAREAYKKGLQLICMTDHGPKMPGAAHLWYFGNLKVLPEKIEGVEILKGVEVNIMDEEGNLDLPEGILKKLDIVIASLHDVCFEPSDDIERNTKAIINAIKNPYVDIIGHPGNPIYPIDIEKVLMAAKEYGKFIEINNSSFVSSRKGSEENCFLIAKKAKEMGVKIAVGSDAHVSFDVGRFEEALKVIKNAGITEDLVLNTDVGKIKEYLKEKKRKIGGEEE
ncbi:putative hydrolase [Thermoanaerobacter thermohydrosulfuricus]|uniref:Probable phosphatase Teth39_0577 n=4 Tax=Thermoanaerobacter TaxID=1754 RepID=Y577_THEP3|nr:MULTISPECIES: phosphatase [Thermoanaerobacter]B0K683.1 RecName: Full=Probable phosphatase Teth514_1060 [Thermoanaerobacter sp. X514]B0K794.1 RecName: Full=Probable phosphatase Teth39_0577 [Thermoanaerobacter pseudethanolicus ATCC 33223]KUJ91644.1 MAG: PHP domain-containing protein [Thermoanaerobacter thermocopriae]KUK34228.1 MAG: phosphatase [Caldanaerobacter subterraneus]ABY92359.1 PHP C-terminal domain protein [Thermoanaerobacter sp. X514]ABY94241.1 PHP C-terminal domain protein [Thermoa